MKSNAIVLNRKYVFHIPLCKCENDELAPIDIGGLLDDLISEFSRKGFEGFYITKSKAYYKSRRFDELLLTMFAASDNPEEIFSEWFRANNDVLGQEAFAWEMGNSLFIENLMK